MNIRDELDKRVYGWLDSWLKENNLETGSLESLTFIMNNTEEFDRRNNANNTKYDITELPEDDNGVYGIPKDDTIIRLVINDITYYVACAERLYCIEDEWKWRTF